MKIFHNNDVVMGTMGSQITSLTIVYSIVYLSADQRKHQSSVLLAFVRGIHRRPVNVSIWWRRQADRALWQELLYQLVPDFSMWPEIESLLGEGCHLGLFVKITYSNCELPLSDKLINAITLAVYIYIYIYIYMVYISNLIVDSGIWWNWEALIRVTS